VAAPPERAMTTAPVGDGCCYRGGGGDCGDGDGRHCCHRQRCRSKSVCHRRQISA